MKVIKPPHSIPSNNTYNLLFLSGSIEMNKASKWQDKVIEKLKNTSWIILNPRRDDWDNSWKQNIKNKQFVKQVNWELEGIEKANNILIYFHPKSKAPITLLELGIITILSSVNIKDVVVVCPYGFWRKGNVDIVCRKNNIKQFNSLSNAIKYFKKKTLVSME